MDSKATLLTDGQPVIAALEKRRQELFLRTEITAHEQDKVARLYQLRFTHVDRSQGQKKRAQGYLEKIHNHSRELYVLYGLEGTYTFLANHTKTPAGLQRILAWWDDLKAEEHPPALKGLPDILLVRGSKSTIDELPPAPNQTLKTTLSPSNNTIQPDTKATLASDSQIPSPPRSNAIQQDTKAASAVDSQLPSPSRSNTVLSTNFAIALDSEPSKKRARTSSGLAANSVDTQSLQECHRIVQLLYPRQNIESLRSLSREQLISLLDSQDLPSRASSTDAIKRSQCSASSPAEGQRAPQAEELLSEAYPLGSSNPFRNTSFANTVERIGITPQTSTSNPHSANAGTTNSLPISFLNFSDVVPEDFTLLQDTNIALPCFSIHNMRRTYIFDFLKQYKGGACTVVIRYSEAFSFIDICCDGAREEYDVRISTTKVVTDALLITLDMGNAVGTSFVQNVPRDEVFHFFQVGPDPGPTLRLVTDWTDTTLLPSMQIPKGGVIMRTSIKVDLIAYIKGMGVALDYREEFNIEQTVPNDGAGYT
jgi:hypothetical protein